jgi:hypothetical protein
LVRSELRERIRAVAAAIRAGPAGVAMDIAVVSNRSVSPESGRRGA